MKDQDWKYIVDFFLFICLGGMVFAGILLGLVIPEGPASLGASKYFLGLHRHQWGDIHAYLSIAFVVLIIIHVVLNWKWITCRTSQIFKRKAAPILAAAACAPFLLLFVFWLLTPKDSAKYRGYGDGPGERGYRHRIVTEKEAAEVADVAAGGGLRTLSEKQSAGGRGRDLQTYPDEKAPGGTGLRGGTAEEEHHRNVGSIELTGRHTLTEIEQATGISGRAIAEKLGLPPTVSMNETLGRLRRVYGFEIQDVRDIVEKMLKE